MGLAKILYSSWIKNFENSDEFERSRVRLLISFTAIGTIISLIYFFVQPYVPFNVPRFVFLILPLLLNGFCLLLLVKIPQNIIAHGITASYWICFVVGSYYSGGIQSFVLPWLCLMPVLSSLLMDYKNSIVWFIISLLCVIGFAFVGDNVPAVRYTEGPWKSMFSTVGLCIILFVFTNLFDRARYKILQILKGRNEEQVRQKKEINRINLQLKDKVQEIATKNEKLEEHWNTIIDVAKNNSIDSGILEVALGHIAQTTAHSLQVSRVSIWTYHHDETSERIECVMAFSASDNQYFSQASLSRDDNDTYFSAIKKERVVAADDAENHPDTRSFYDNYLKPLRIKSMMDAPFFDDGKLAGVLCIEHQWEHKTWKPEDIMFATSMAEIISLAYRSVTRRIQQEKLSSLSHKIKMQNQNLEERVAQRTRELTDKNHQLAEYAFINAHILRGAFCRVQGLINLLEYYDYQDKEILQRLHESSTELESIINKMTLAIEEGSDLSRTDLTANKQML